MLELVELLLRLIQLLVAFESFDLLLPADFIDLFLLPRFRLFLFNFLDLVGGRARNTAREPRAQCQTKKNDPE